MATSHNGFDFICLLCTSKPNSANSSTISFVHYLSGQRKLSFVVILSSMAGIALPLPLGELQAQDA